MQIHTQRGAFRSIVVLLALLFSGCIASARSNRPLLRELEVGKITVEAAHVGRADSEDREWFRALLEEQAAAAAGRTLLEENAAAAVRRSPSDAAEGLRLVGRVSVPIALPPDYRGSRAAFQKGHVATARVELLNGPGEVASAQSVVRWADVRWTTGSAKTRRVRNPDLALIDAAELAVRRAVRELVAAMEVPRLNGTSAVPESPGGL